MRILKNSAIHCRFYYDNEKVVKFMRYFPFDSVFSAQGEQFYGVISVRSYIMCVAQNIEGCEYGIVFCLCGCTGMRTTQFSWVCEMCFECVACAWRRRRSSFHYSMVTYLYGFYFFYTWYGRQILFEWVQLSSIADAVRYIKQKKKSFHHFHLISKCVEFLET